MKIKHFFPTHEIILQLMYFPFDAYTFENANSVDLGTIYNRQLGWHSSSMQRQ